MKVLVPLFCLMNFIWSADSDAHRQQEVIAIQKGAKPEDVPAYQGVDVPESHLNHRNIESARPSKEGQEGGDLIVESFDERPKFTIDPKNDPIFIRSFDALNEADAIQSKTTFKEKTETQFEMVTCREGREEGSFDCYETLIDLKISIDPAKSSHWWCTSGNHGPDDRACAAKKYYDVPKIYQEEKVHVSGLEWAGTCKKFEDRERQGLCRKGPRVCTQKGETRMFEGTLNGKPVARGVFQPCWQYKTTYICGSSQSASSSCADYRSRGYEQVESKCIKTLGKICSEWEQTFKKPLSSNTQDKIVSINQKGDSIQGSRDQRLAPPDQHFAEAATKLSIFGEMQKDIKSFAGAQDLKEPKIFKGEGKKCRKNGVINCCGSEKGSRVAVSVKLARCTPGENDLFQKRVKGQCHYVGEYCALKVPLTGICRLWKQSFCCFPSKLSRIVHEQGRPQINMHWGSAQDPGCDGFRVESLQKLDFSHFDLSEFYEDIQKRVKLAEPGKVQTQIANRFQTMTSSQTNNTREGGH